MPRSKPQLQKLNILSPLAWQHRTTSSPADAFLAVRHANRLPNSIRASQFDVFYSQMFLCCVNQCRSEFWLNVIEIVLVKNTLFRCWDTVIHLTLLLQLSQQGLTWRACVRVFLRLDELYHWVSCEFCWSPKRSDTVRKRAYTLAHGYRVVFCHTWGYYSRFLWKEIVNASCASIPFIILVVNWLENKTAKKYHRPDRPGKTLVQD